MFFCWLGKMLRKELYNETVFDAGTETIPYCTLYG